MSLMPERFPRPLLMAATLKMPETSCVFEPLWLLRHRLAS